MIPSVATKHDTSVLVLEKEETEKLSPRILELRKKIHDSEYLDNAVQRIAFVISQKLVENPEELTLRESEE
ncbi:MAG: hypothetical protein HUK25_10340 [Treponema sp.]|nr:hypothetical protein [Treponema sp.]